MAPPKWVRPQLSRLAAKAPSGPQWIHEIKLDGYHMTARIADGAVQLLTRSGLDWTDKYPSTAAALAKAKVRSAYLDGELCGIALTASPRSNLCSRRQTAAAPGPPISCLTCLSSIARI